MEDYQQRVVDEMHELYNKIEALARFLTSDTVDEIERPDRNLLQTQFSIMEAYIQILQMRINRFDTDTETNDS